MNATGFYVVWCPQSGPPSVQHRSSKSALAEAKRLAALNPGKEFFVLQAMRVAMKNDVSVTELTADEEIPF